MVLKLVLSILVLAFLFALLFPRRIPRILRSLGAGFGDVGRVGRELLTGKEVAGSPLARYEAAVGGIVAAKVLAGETISSDTELQARVEALGRRLALRALRREIPYSFTVLEGSEPNAFAVPGGSIFVTRGLVDLCGGSDPRLAGVLAHEIVHVDRRHAIQQLARSTFLRAGIRVLPLGRAVSLTRMAGAIEELISKGYRREKELEADLLGMQLARAAGFAPEGLLELLERLGSLHPRASGPLAAALQYFQTHPPLPERVARLRDALWAPGSVGPA